jgi:hypothetical protein
MKTLLPSKSYNRLNQKISAYRRRLLVLYLSFSGFILAATSVRAINHPPFVSWIPDQRITSPSQGFAPQYFRIINYDAGVTVSPMKSSTSTWYPASKAE